VEIENGESMGASGIEDSIDKLQELLDPDLRAPQVIGET